MKTFKNISISTATMRKEDLIPCFYEFVKENNQNYFDDSTILYNRIVTFTSDEGIWESYYDSEDSDYDLEELFDAMETLADDGYYFGSHPGDGANYGFWEIENN